MFFGDVADDVMDKCKGFWRIVYRYTIYKLSFPNGIHISEQEIYPRKYGKSYSFHSLFFQTMCIRALNKGGERT